MNYYVVFKEKVLIEFFAPNHDFAGKIARAYVRSAISYGKKNGRNRQKSEFSLRFRSE